MKTSDKVFLSISQLAERLSCSVASMYRWKREGDFPKGVKLGPGTVRWRLQDIEEWENSRPNYMMTDITLDDSPFLAERSDDPEAEI
jgi:prophage regulatory protein